MVPAVEIVLLVSLVASNPWRLNGETKWSRLVSAGLALIIIIANQVSLGLLVHALVEGSSQGSSLLVAAMQVWATNVIGFGLFFWELDRGGPVARRETPREHMAPADWRFTHDEDQDTVTEVASTSSIKSGWIPLFADYLYLSLTNSSAFSPTDTMPLTTRTKALMGIEATSALLTSLLVIARAVGSLGN